MSVAHIAEVALAIVLLIAGIYFYRRPSTDGQPGGQGAVLLGLIAIDLVLTLVTVAVGAAVLRR